MTIKTYVFYNTFIKSSIKSPLDPSIHASGSLNYPGGKVI
jgi:hypothetical protein